MPRVIHFEIPSHKPERAVHFYREAFGWEIIKWEGPADYWLVTTGPDSEPGINGAILKRMEGQATTNTIDVPSVDEFIEKIINAGGKVLLQKKAIPGIGWQAYCLDTEGNAFGIHQVDPDAH